MNWFKIENSFPHVDINTTAAIAIFCWFIWKSKNDIVFGNDNNSPSKIMFDACRLIQNLSDIVDDQDEGLRSVGTTF